MPSIDVSAIEPEAAARRYAALAEKFEAGRKRA
jgi:hypothetical protein